MSFKTRTKVAFRSTAVLLFFSIPGLSVAELSAPESCYGLKDSSSEFATVFETIRDVVLQGGAGADIFVFEGALRDPREVMP